MKKINLREKIGALAEKISTYMKTRAREARRFVEYKRLKRVRKHNVPQYTYCMNCGEVLQGMYCYKCGQYALDVNQSFGKYLRQFIENTYQFDGKLVQSVRFLITKPGFLSEEFVKGRISSYVHPLKFYMFISILLFSFVLLLYSDIDIYEKLNNRLGGKDTIASIKFNKEYDEDKDDIKSLVLLDKKRSEDSVTPQDKPAKDAKEKGIDKKQLNTIYREAFTIVTKYSPLILLLLIPVYGAITRMCFGKECRNYMHNIVFAFHLHTLFLLLVSICVLLIYWFDFFLIRWFLIFFVIYHVMAVHRFYKRGLIKSVFGSIISLTLYGFVFFLVSLGLFVALVYRISKELDAGVL